MQANELHWSNLEEYSSKILLLEKNESSKFMFHSKTIKSWFINSGKFVISIIDTKIGSEQSHPLSEGQTLHFPPLTVHKLTVIEPGSITEVSTQDPNKDVFYIG